VRLKRESLELKMKKRKPDDLVKSMKRRISVIPANPGSGPGQAPESRVPGENRDPVSRVAPGFRRGDGWRDFLRDHQVW